MDAFNVLADPTRRQIIEGLCQGERAFGEIAEQFDISNPAVSQHLKVLRNAGIVSSRAEAQRRIYRLTEQGLIEVDEWLNHVRRFWNRRLDNLEQVLREEEEPL